MTSSTATSELPEHDPEVGQLVHVRSRRWLVEEVQPGEKPGQSSVVRLACAEDDAQGEEIEVFWDCEIDRRILKQAGWAELAAKGFDTPRRFSAFLHTLRWNCVTATDPNLFQAPFRAGIKLDAYQMEPLRNITPRHRAAAATASSRSSPEPYATSAAASSTGSSSPRRRTTATRTASPHCWNCSTRTASPAASRCSRSRSMRSWCDA